MKTLLLALFCAAAVAQTAPQLTDVLRLEIAQTQRDLLLADARMKEAIERYTAAKAEAEKLQQALGQKVAQAKTACGAQVFDDVKLACVASEKK